MILLLFIMITIIITYYYYYYYFSLMMLPEKEKTYYLLLLLLLLLLLVLFNTLCFLFIFQPDQNGSWIKTALEMHGFVSPDGCTRLMTAHVSVMLKMAQFDPCKAHSNKTSARSIMNDLSYNIFEHLPPYSGGF